MNMMVRYNRLYASVQSFHIQNREIKQTRAKTGKRVLTREQKKRITEYYKGYKRPSFVFHNYYTEKTGIFREDYIPDDLYFGYIDPHFNNKEEAKYLDNKCYYSFLFPSVRQPRTVFRRMNGICYLGEGTDVILPEDRLAECFVNESAAFIKVATESLGGHGVQYAEGNDILLRVKELMHKTSKDIIVQAPIKQSPALARLNPSSVNTIRIMSILGLDGEVKINSCYLRMGIGDAKVDNASSGGISCGIKMDGTLNEIGYTKRGEKMEKHPTSGIVFRDYRIPGFDKLLALAKALHPTIPHFRMVSWDFSLDENDEIVLIEVNLSRGGLCVHQLNNGPLFGEDTKRILDEVFCKK